MILIDQIKRLSEEALTGLNAYVADIKIKPSNVIYVFLDSDDSVKIEDCIIVSKYIESNLDRESEDFELNVSSYGAEQPLRFSRQYIKNIGRNIKVETNNDEIFNAVLTNATEDYIILSVSAKKKKEAAKEVKIEYSDIKEAKIVISFK